MKNRKFMLCQYPDNGFGSKNSQYYLLDVFGNKYDIVDDYDKVLDEMNKLVVINGYPYCEHSVTKLIESLEIRFDAKIEKW